MDKHKTKTRSPAIRSQSPNTKTDPTPLDLDYYIPWEFMKLQSSQTVVVKRVYQAKCTASTRITGVDHPGDYIGRICPARSPSDPIGRHIQHEPLGDFSGWTYPVGYPRDQELIKMFVEDYPRGRNTRFTSSSRISRVSTTVSIRQTESYPALLPTIPSSTSISNVDNAIQLTIFYNRAGYAVEIAIISCPFPINHELIKVISVSLPYHTRLNRLTCKGKGLDYSVINEIAKALPFSNLTDICLDNSFVPEGNYYIILDQESTLKCLSLNKCRINDVVCKKIAKRLELGGPASKHLRVLCLSCNFITDIGAQALGNVLRTNRHIVHLNLCGNGITSAGAGYLLEPLSQFPFTTDEIKEKLRRRREFYKEKSVINKSSRSTIANCSTEKQTNNNDRNSLQKNALIDSKTNKNGTELDENVVEDFSHPSNTVYKNGRWFSTGNLTLCSLNIGYNDLDYTILLRIVDVLMYQKDQDRGPRCTGLLRIVIEGNNLPINCEEYSKIEIYLAMLNNAAWSFRKKRKGSVSAKTRRDGSITRGRNGSPSGVGLLP